MHLFQEDPNLFGYENGFHQNEFSISKILINGGRNKVRGLGKKSNLYLGISQKRHN